MAIAVRVAAAFFGSGGLKAWTPLAMASVPVRATEPAEKARSRSTMPAAWVISTVPSTISAGGTPSPSTTTR